MKEKERFELQEVFEDGSFHWCLKDNDTKLLKPLVNLYNCVDLLNQQDARIKELEAENGYIIFADGYDKNGNEIHRQEFVKYKDKFNELVEENKKLKIENGSLKEKISTQLQNNADNVDFMENQRKEIEHLKEKLKDIKNNYRRQIDSLLIARLNLFKQLKQSQKQLAINELEKLKDFIDHNIEIENDVGALKLQEFYSNQIKKLKGD